MVQHVGVVREQQQGAWITAMQLVLETRWLCLPGSAVESPPLRVMYLAF